MVFRRAISILAVLAATACSDLPKDPDGTLERVRAERLFRVGVVAPGANLPDLGKQRLLLARIIDRTGARPALTIGASEQLLSRLEAGEIDLVIGEFDPNSPWRKRVAILPPLDQEGGADKTRLAAVAANGENAWIGLLYREGRAIRAGSP